VGWLKFPAAMKTQCPAAACLWIKAAVEVSDPATKSPLKTCKIFTADLPYPE